MTFAVEKCGHNGETLLSDPLAWVGAKGGQAFERDPLPISTDDETCFLRPFALKALADHGRVWRWVCEDSNFDPILATLDADIAVAPLLASAPVRSWLRDPRSLFAAAQPHAFSLLRLRQKKCSQTMSGLTCVVRPRSEASADEAYDALKSAATSGD
ncbi:hypothetical protein EDC40_102529 [Aminobacter aminovorans]|uniref:Uncharacterized protein n=1 Tax=Aminobacter aminovorans TaxID=83263 RepID=A0A380WL03_AMIAI|nr:hypothetical protein EDC40_102529 [Aminobacter aminovorans]SUU88936.1 Uncharacterised protein [Aminobacter aminovorans]